VPQNQGKYQNDGRKRKPPDAETSGQEIGTVLRGMYSSEVTNSSARLETEMPHGKGLRSIVKEILANAKT
jgi:hypothetical protein